MKNTITLSLLSCLLLGCSANFYEYKAPAAMKVYDSPRGPGSPSFMLPAGENVIVKKNTTGPYRQARYKDYYGWIYLDSLQAVRRSNSKSFGNPEDGFVWDTSVSPMASPSKPASAKTRDGNGANGHSYGRGNGMHRHS